MKQLLFPVLLMAIFNHLSAQNVGIGTATPVEKLEIAGNVRLSAGAARSIAVGDATVEGQSGNSLRIAAGNTIFSGVGSSGGNLELEAGNTNSAGGQAGGNIIMTTGRNFWAAGGNVSARHGDIIFRGGSNPGILNIVEHARMNGTTGNWGFGTATPTARLDVIGTVKTTGLQLTTGANAGFVMTSDANGVASWVNASSLDVTESDPEVGANTTNYLSKWNGTQLVTSGVFDNGGNVGIGTASPTKKLEVAGTGGLRVNSANTGTGTTDWVAGNFGGTAGNRVVMGVLNGTASIGAHNNALVAWANLAINPDGGNVGVGTAAPANKLSVSGNMDVTGNVGVGTATPANKLSVSGTMDVTGNLGVATTIPVARLDVNGTFKLGATGGVLNNLLKFNANIESVNVGANNSAAISITPPASGIVLGSTVYVSPSLPLPAGIGIGFARVSTTGTVEVVFTNGTNVPVNTPAMVLYITVIN